jgi:hypothetical protein
MKVFISWSGNQSKKLGEAIRDWLPAVLQVVTPYFTPADIEKGTRWSTDISKELEDSQVGILCITRDNLHSDWILFEAGALSKRLQKSHVCPILFGITNTDLAGPLKQFQTTEFEKNDFLKLINVINNQLSDHRLPQKTLENVFEKWWPDLELKIKEILAEVEVINQPIRSDRELLEEILTLHRNAVSRSSRPNIPLEVVKDIIKTVINIHHGQSNLREGYQATLDSLKEMNDAVTYIARRYKGTSGEIDELINQFLKLDYLAEDIEFEEEQNDMDIPF